MFATKVNMHRISRIRFHLSPGSWCPLCPHISAHPFMYPGLRKSWFCAGPHRDPLHSSMGCNCWLWGGVGRLVWACDSHWTWQSWPSTTAPYQVQLISKNSNNSKRSEQAWLLSHLASAWKLTVPQFPTLSFPFSVTVPQIPSSVVSHAWGYFRDLN